MGLIRLGVFGFSVLFLGSCASLNQSVSYIEDDIYYSNSFQHRFNQQALLANQNVAMPDSAIEYFNESYAQTLRPNYSNRLNRLEDDGLATDSSLNQPTYYDDMEELNRNRWWNNVSVGVGMGAFYGYNAYYGGGYYPNYYYNPYPASYTRTYRPSVPMSNTTTDVYRPYIAPGNNRGTNPMLSAPQSRQNKPYINPNANYNNGNQNNRTYRTRNSNGNNNGVWSNPGYYQGGGSSRSGGSYSGGTVRGYYRR
jgi:uncharacterized membrane protein YgcG